MEDVLGGRTDPRLFAAFLADWESILARRVDVAVSDLAAIDGVRGLILAGGVGRGEPWPLSDIDLLPIYDHRIDSARAAVEAHRRVLLQHWVEEGWWTGLDIGRLAFRRDEVAAVVGFARSEATTLLVLDDDRWYHALDKGYQGRAVYDPDGLAGPLTRWLTDRRFDPPVVRFRLRRARREAVSMAARAGVEATSDSAEATSALRAAVSWTRVWLLETWGERDNSLGRVGTRFDRTAHYRGRQDTARVLNDLSALAPVDVERRMASAPAWVKERHDRSFRARRLVGEDVSRLEDARDTLRVCSRYAARRAVERPFPTWLAIESYPGRVTEGSAHLLALVAALAPDTA